MKRRRATLGGFLLLSFLIVAMGCIWWWVLPPQFMGRTTFLTTKGISMEPHLSRGDLAILRKQPRYFVGDVIAYHSQTLNATTLHRIIAIDANGISTQGDNNTWIDLDHPKPNEIIGKLDTHIDGGGKYVDWLRPLPVRVTVAILIGLLTYFIIRGFSRPTYVLRRKAGVAQPHAPPPSSRVSSATSSATGSAAGKPHRTPRTWRKLRLAGLTLGILLLSVGAICTTIGFVQPIRTAGGESIYTLKGRFDYSGNVPPRGEVVYGSQTFATGDPLYYTLVDYVTTQFRISVDSLSRFKGNGTLEMTYSVNGKSGWHREFPLASKVELEGGEGTISGEISVANIRNLVNEVAQTTEIRDNAFTVSIQATATVDGKLGSQPLQLTFPSSLVFSGDSNVLKLAPAPSSPTSRGPRSDRLAYTPISQGIDTAQGGSIVIPSGEHTEVSFSGYAVRVSVLRYAGIAALMLGVALIGACYRRKALDLTAFLVAAPQRLLPMRVEPVTSFTEPDLPTEPTPSASQVTEPTDHVPEPAERPEPGPIRERPTERTGPAAPESATPSNESPTGAPLVVEVKRMQDLLALSVHHEATIHEDLSGEAPILEVAVDNTVYRLKKPKPRRARFAPKSDNASDPTAKPPSRTDQPQ